MVLDRENEAKKGATQNTKYTGVDIVRIVSTIFVFIIHFRLNIQPWESYSNFVNLYNSYIKQFLAFFMWSIIDTAVPIFLIISGFCNYKYEEVTFKSYITKIIKNYLPYFVACIFYLITYIFIGEVKDINGILQWAKKVTNFSLSYMWYMGSYLILLLLMPFINRAVKKLSNKEHIILICILILAVSMPTTINLYKENILNEYYVKGFNIVLYYIIGTFFRKNVDLINTKLISKMTIIATITILISFILLPISNMKIFNTNGILYLVVSISIFVNILYYGNKIKENKAIMKLSSVTIFMYMIGWNYERIIYFLYGTKIFTNNIIYCIIFIIGEIVVTALISIILKKVLDKATKRILKILNV